MAAELETSGVEDFLATMMAFVSWYWRTVDPRFVDMLAKQRGESRDDIIGNASHDIVMEAARQTRGNRGDEAGITPADYWAIMDRVAAFYMRVAHGPDAVRSDIAPDAFSDDPAYAELWRKERDRRDKKK